MTSHIARRRGKAGRFPRIASCSVAAFMAGVCLVAAGRGHLGSPTDTSTGSGSLVTTTFNPTFSVSPGAGESATSVVSRLITAINADPNFIASPVGVGTTTFQVVPSVGGDLTHLLVSETDPGIKEAGVSFDAPGRAWLAINKIAGVAGNGNYRLIIDFATGADYDQTFDTTTAPTNTASGLNTAIQVSLAAAGVCSLTDSGTGLLYIQRLGTKILSATQSATDSAISGFTVDVTDTAPATPGSCVGIGGVPGIYVPVGAAGTPTLSEFGLFVLAALLVCAALFVLRRRGIRDVR